MRRLARANRLVEEGLYLNRGQIVREALRYVFRGYGLDPFRFSEGPPREGGRRGRPP